jgi:hypothetical protein
MTAATFLEALLRNPFNQTILRRLPEIELADAWLVSGAVFQTVWNVMTGREPTFGIKDYDIFYFDGDTSWEAEDAVIRRAAEFFSDLAVKVETRNQARVHLWYPEKFGAPYPSAARATDGIDRFLMLCAQVGIRRRGSAYDIYAPNGFDDVEQMIVRPNPTPNFRSARYSEKAARWKSFWPELTILPAENGERA